MLSEVGPERGLSTRTGLSVRTGLQAGRPLGDLVAGFTHATGLDRLTDAYSAITGKDCGCDERREALNELVPRMPF